MLYILLDNISWKDSDLLQTLEQSKTKASFSSLCKPYFCDGELLTSIAELSVKSFYKSLILSKIEMV